MKLFSKTIILQYMEAIRSKVLNGEYDVSLDKDDNGFLNVIDVILSKTTTTSEPKTVTYDVTSPGYYYIFSGITTRNPEIKLSVGDTLVLNFDLTSNHPIRIYDTSFDDTVVDNTTSGTYTIQGDKAKTLTYICIRHASMTNTISFEP